MTRAAPDVEEVLSERALLNGRRPSAMSPVIIALPVLPVQFRPTPRGLGVKAERPP